MADELIRLDTMIIDIDVLINKAETSAEANALFKAKDVIYSQQRYFSDVQPGKRGRWEKHHATYIKQLDAWFVQARCSCCHRYSDKIDNYSQYLDLEFCSHCGADMRGRADEQS